MQSFKKYVEDTGGTREDEELLNYFTDLYQRKPFLMNRSIGDIMSKWASDENAPKREDPRLVRATAEKAKQSVEHDPEIKDEPARPAAFDRSSFATEQKPRADDDEYYAGLAQKPWVTAEPEDNYYDRYTKGLDRGYPDANASRRVSKKEREEILNLAQKGQSAQDIGFHLELPVWVIQGIMDRAGASNKQNAEFNRGQREIDQADAHAKRPWDKPHYGNEAGEKELDAVARQQDMERRNQYTKDTAWGWQPWSRTEKAPDDGTWGNLMKNMDMRHGRKIAPPSPEQEQEIRNLHKQGWKPRAIALDLKIPVKNVASVLGIIPKNIDR